MCRGYMQTRMEICISFQCPQCEEQVFPLASHLLVEKHLNRLYALLLDGTTNQLVLTNGRLEHPGATGLTGVAELRMIGEN